MTSGLIRRCHSRDFACKSFRTIVPFCTGGHPADEMCKAAKKKKLVKTLREKTPVGRLDELEEGRHPFQEKDPLPPFPGGVNPETGEVGGPRGPEPTRYGDWERKGRVTDF